MSCKSMLCMTVTTAVAISLAAPSFGQYQGYPATSVSNSPAPQRTQLPRWETPQPPVTQTRPYGVTNETSPAPHAYSPSEMPSVSPFANVRSHQQQMPANYDNAPYQIAPQYHQHPAPLTYYGYAASAGDPQQQSAVGGGLPYQAPAYPAPVQQAAPAQQPNSYYEQPTQNYWSQPNYGIDQKAAASLAGAGLGVRSGWYGGAIGMIMNRSRANNVWLSYDQDNIRDRVLKSNDARFSTAGGVGADIGHYFNGGQNSVQFVYWGIYPGVSEANAYGANTVGGIDTILHFDGLQYDAGTGPLSLSSTFFFNAERHRVQRSWEVHNLELNLIGHNFTSACSPWQLSWIGGIRYLRFDEDFLYSSDVVDTVFTGNPEEVHYGIDVDNNLLGFQLGSQANYCVGPRWGLFANTKAGLYNNHMTQQSRIYGSNGQAFVGDPASPYLGQDVNSTTSKNSYSMIAELSVGANWNINSCWSLNAGYRAVGISGVALSTNQIPGDFIGALDSIRTVNSNGSLLLHGAFAGVDYCY